MQVGKQIVVPLKELRPNDANPRGESHHEFGVREVGWVDVSHAPGYLFFCTKRGFQGEVYGEVGDVLLEELKGADPKHVEKLMGGIGNFLGGDCTSEARQALCEWRTPAARASRVGEVLGTRPMQPDDGAGLGPFVLRTPNPLRRLHVDVHFDTLKDAVRAYLAVETGRAPRVLQNGVTLIAGDPECGGSPMFSDAGVQRCYFDVCCLEEPPMSDPSHDDGSPSP